MKKQEKGWIDVFILAAAIVISGVLTAYVGQHLWNSIIVQLFDVRTLSAVQTLAICLVADFIIYKAPTKEQQERTTKDILIHSISANLTFLIVGWVLIQFI
ncbi:hypothetical protein I6N96_08985 [Enterococcus sp. BWM-S5]|uniref:Uncharacterized protein n=1 Tax=Enterococcus larvae TaxID=2794352 RepID=A0ABS4CJR4_9ENTE|nr:hypothetical protein [Enterococcus larvae]MBP1046418.1 hypothetical protein [Enterococcus larvae]